MDLSFDPQKSLFSLPIVRLLLKLSFGTSLIITIIIAGHAHGVPWDFSGEGFSRFVELFKVPISIIAIGLTLIGICGANHRSEQTKRQIERTSEQILRTDEQIKLTRSQNNFSNYFKHVEEFEKYCKLHVGKIELSARRSTHSRIFKKARQGDFSIDEKVREEFEKNLLSLMRHFLNLSRGASNWEAPAGTIIFIRNELSLLYSGTPIPADGIPFTYMEKELTIPNGTDIGLYESVIEVVNYVDTLFKFDQHYESSMLFRNLTKANLKEFPESDIRARESYFITSFTRSDDDFYGQPINDASSNS